MHHKIISIVLLPFCQRILNAALFEIYFKAHLLVFISLLCLGPLLGQSTDIVLEKLDIKGYSAVFSDNGSTFLYIDGKSNEYKKYYIESKKDVALNISAKGTLINNSPSNYLLIQNRKQNYNFIPLDIDSSTKKDFLLEEKLIVYPSEDLRSIILQTGNSKKQLKPLQHADYINVSLSPDQTKILFRATGLGAYVIDREANIIATFSSAQFPSWVSNSKLLFAKVLDDGYQYISSSLYFADINSLELTKIDLKTSITPLFPSPNKDGSKIIFNSPESQLYILNMK